MTIDSKKAKGAVDALRSAYDKKPARTQRQNATDRLLVSIPRGQSEELRLAWSEYEGKPYLSLRLWQKGDDGALLPTKKGISIRLRELPDLTEALINTCNEASAYLERQGDGVSSGG